MRKLQRVYNTWKGYCQWCDQPTVLGSTSSRGASRDHIVAKSAGGSWALTNLMLACQGCNRDRGARSFEEYLIFRELVATGLFKKGKALKAAQLLYKEMINT